jgi:phage tail-like protein
MAIYGVSFYGTSTYGAPPFLEIESRDFTVTPLRYTDLLLEWANPGSVGAAAWTHMRLVRSSYGAPVSLSDGVTLFEDPQATARTSYQDMGLRPGRFYYYSLFVRVASDSVWRQSATAIGLVTHDFGFGANLMGRLPSLYSERDANYGDPGPLQRFLNMLGYQYDRIRTELETLRDVSNIDTVSGNLLPVMAASLGVSYEPELGQRISRTIIKNAVYAAKVKGTVLGVEAVASAYTGYGAEAVIGPNLMLDYNDSDFLESTGNWTATQNATLVRSAPGALSPPIANVGALLITATAATTDAVVISGRHVNLTLIPVSAGQTYTASMYVQTAVTARTVTWSLIYYDASGTVLSVFTQSSADTTSWVRRTVSGLAPASAKYVALRVTVVAPAAGEVHRVAAVQIETGGTATTWESARQIHVYLDPNRANLVPNPSAEVNTTGWTAGANTTLSRTTATFSSGVAAFRLTSVAAGAISATTTTGAGGIVVLPSTPYTVQARLRANTVARGTTVGIAWYTVAGALISTVTSASANDTVGAWTRQATHTATSPATAARAAIIVTVAATGAASEIHDFDAVMLEQSEFLSLYFDASTAPASDYLWGGTAHNSTSFFYPRRDIRNARLNAVLPNHVPAGTTAVTHFGMTAPLTSV